MHMMMKLALASAAIALSSAQSIAAEDKTYTQICTFNVECFEQEACTASNYEVSVKYSFTPLEGKPDEGAGTGSISDEVKDRKAIVTHSNGAFVANMVDWTSNRTISEEIYTIASTADGQARLVTLLTDAPIMITYHGTCEGDG